MKKLRIIVLVMCLVAFSAIAALSEENQGSGSGDQIESNANVVFDQSDNSTGKKTYNAAGIQETHPNPGGVGGYNGHVQPPYNYDEHEYGSPEADPLHQLLGNRVYSQTLFHRNGIVPEDLEGAKVWGVKLDVRNYENVKVNPRFTVKAEEKSIGRKNPKKRLYLLHYRPLDRDLWVKGRCHVYLKKDGMVPERPFEAGLEALWKETEAQFYYVEFNRDLIGSLDGYSSALTGVYSTLVNPKDYIANALIGILASIGKTSNDSKVWKQPIFTIIAYPRYVSIERSKENNVKLQPLYRELWPDESQAVVQTDEARDDIREEDIRTDGGAFRDDSEGRAELRSERLQCPSVKFTFDSAVIGPEQMDAIYCMNEKIASEELGPFEHWAIVGSTCEIGSVAYNLNLGGERADEVREVLEEKELEAARSVAMPLAAADSERTGSPALTQERIWIMSEGEYRLKYNQAGTAKRNEPSPEREAYLVKVTDDTLR